MVPGITHTECRIAQIHSCERLAAVDRQRGIDAAIPVPAGRVHVLELIGRSTRVIRAHLRYLLPGVRTDAAMDRAAAPCTVVMN